MSIAQVGVVTPSAATGPSAWLVVLVICIAGAVGGVINVLLSPDNKIALPTRKKGYIVPGFPGNIVLGAAAGFITWGLAGSAAEIVLLGSSPADATPLTVTVSNVLGALLAGAAGTRAITAEIDKRFLKAAAVESQRDGKKAAGMRAASPLDTLAIADGELSVDQ